MRFLSLSQQNVLSTLRGCFNNCIIFKINHCTINLFLGTKQKQPPEVFYKKGVLNNFAELTGKLLCQSLFFNEVAGHRPATLLK